MRPGGEELDRLLTAMRGAAEEAGAMLLDGLTGPKRVRHKGEVDLVTEHDLAAEELVRARLIGLDPRIGMLAEEGGATEQGEARWIVDPLDGTTNFAHGHPLFGVSIGLEWGRDLLAGVIHVPAIGLTTWARRGGGAFRNGEPCRVSTRRSLDDSLLATGFPYDRRTADDDNTRELRAFMKAAQGVRRCGAATVDLALVACGVYDGFWEPRLHPWDLAAGVVIVGEAGGRVSGYDDGPVDIHNGWIVASNGQVHERMIEILATTRAELP